MFYANFCAFFKNLVSFEILFHIYLCYTESKRKYIEIAKDREGFGIETQRQRREQVKNKMTKLAMNIIKWRQGDSEISL